MPKSRPLHIAPSLLAADFANLQAAVEMCNRSEASFLHYDIMDGHFVPNLSFGLPVLAAIGRHATKPLDVHLMIADPDRYLEAFRDAGAHFLTVHVEACPHLHRTVQAIRALGMQPGVAINPATALETLYDILPEVALVCVMSVNPGFGGQAFIPGTMGRVRRLRAMLETQASQALLEVDGGVGFAIASQLVAAGADVLVAGNSVFAQADPEAAIAALAATER
jgi:ribulose-phosphate 3-epimerase